MGRSNVLRRSWNTQDFGTHEQEFVAVLLPDEAETARWAHSFASDRTAGLLLGGCKQQEI